ncbi:MAG: SMP-30/gluconolactonase/LRE family protein [Hyphomonadaceae bacterium]
MDFEVVAEGLAFPEGPVVMPDGSVLVVEIKSGALTRCWNGRKEKVAQIGGGPNGAALGPDGALYITNNGGFTWIDILGLAIPTTAAPDYTTGRVERVDLATGKVERVYESVDGEQLSGPNDIVFEQSGAFWFTDLGKWRHRVKERGGLYYAQPDGSHIREVSYGTLGFNGVGLSPDERAVYVAETDTARLYAFDVTTPGEVAPNQPGAWGRFVAAHAVNAQFDSLAVQADGGVCVATILHAGITTITPAGVMTHTPFPDPLTTNIAFAGADMRDAYITLSGTGKLIKARWPAPGKQLNFNPY